MNKRETALVAEIQRFCIHDGPGIRTTVFFKGCPLNCRWCHNPEMKKFCRQIWVDPSKCLLCGACTVVCTKGCHEVTDRHVFSSENCESCGKCIDACPIKAISWCGKPMSIEQILEAAEADRAFYGNEGGITLSGGEPMAQGDFAVELMKEAKARQLTVCVETAGFFDKKYIPDLCRYADTIFWDVKDTDPIRHGNNTGVSLDVILSNLEEAAKICPEKITVRNIRIKGITDNDETRDGIIRLCERLNITSYRFFDFHPYGNGKMNNIGDHVSERMGKEFIPKKMQ